VYECVSTGPPASRSGQFAKKHPVKKELNSGAAQHMRPSQLKIDYINNQWIGEFSI
jgi:hypothetical protein